MRSVLQGLRLLLWLAVAATVMAMRAVWGPDAGVPIGPPHQLERHAVGAVLLVAIAAIALTISGRRKHPPAWWARGVAAAAGVAAVAVAFAVRAKVGREGTAHLIEGAGWAWMAAGAGAAALAGLASLALPRPRAAGSRRRR